MTLDCLGAHEQLGRHLAGGRSGDGQLHDLLLVRGQELGEGGAEPRPGTSDGLELVGGALRPRRGSDQLEAFVRALELLTASSRREPPGDGRRRDASSPLRTRCRSPVPGRAVANCRAPRRRLRESPQNGSRTSAVKGRGSCSLGRT